MAVIPFWQKLSASSDPATKQKGPSGGDVDVGPVGDGGEPGFTCNIRRPEGGGGSRQGCSPRQGLVHAPCKRTLFAAVWHQNSCLKRVELEWVAAIASQCFNILKKELQNEIRTIFRRNIVSSHAIR